MSFLTTLCHQVCSCPFKGHFHLVDERRLWSRQGKARHRVKKARSFFIVMLLKSFSRRIIGILSPALAGSLK